MTREIEFSFWNKQKKEMWDVQSVDWNAREVCNGGDIASLDDGILLQYTGLKDKNGKKIYEGYIVGGTLEDGTNGRSPVFWDYNCYQPFSYLNCRSEDLEILGNIYENPELLKGVE